MARMLRLVRLFRFSHQLQLLQQSVQPSMQYSARPRAPGTYAYTSLAATKAQLRAARAPEMTMEMAMKIVGRAP